MKRGNNCVGVYGHRKYILDDLHVINDAEQRHPNNSLLSKEAVRLEKKYLSPNLCNY